MSPSQLKCMQQIAALIIMLSAYVECIRNAGGGSGSGSDDDVQHSYDSYPLQYSITDTFSPAAKLSHTPNTYLAARQSGSFRPSQIIEFTTSDATAPHNYPPSYLDTHYSAPINSQAAQVRYDKDKYFAFPNDQNAASSAYSSYQDNTDYSPTSSVPAQLQSTPILTYRDPYTNENHHYRPTPPSPYQHRPQEYTVQSSLLVDSQVPGNAKYPRPGYVFDEQLTPSYERPPYANKYAQHQQQHANILPTYNRESPPQQQPSLQELSEPPLAQRPVTQKLSYDSHDYPPPSYFQAQTSNFQSPQRQDTLNYAPPAPPPPSPPLSSALPNYANNFGNYLQGEQYPQNYKRPPPHYTNDVQYAPANKPPSRPFRPPPPPPPHSGYYDEYQQGEIPPPNYPNYRPPYRPPPQQQQQQQQQQSSGLGSLSSLFATTQQYAPQFTNLLLGSITGGGGGSSSANNPLGSILGAFTGAPSNTYAGAGGGGASTATASRPLNMQLIRALENIARNDDLECVPKVLCQMIAGQTQRGQLPSVVTSPAITNFLAGFPASSPALIYGRAALLGISGGERSCTQTYAKCPKNEYEILYYLNNHRGGFFKFFSEPEEKPTAGSQSSEGVSGGGGGGAASIFSILSMLTGNPTTTTPRPTTRPTVNSPDITSGIGNFFSSVLSEYLGGVEYQRRRRRRRMAVESVDEADDLEGEYQQETDSEDFHDEEDEEDTQGGEGIEDNAGEMPMTQQSSTDKPLLNAPAGQLNAVEYWSSLHKKRRRRRALNDLQEQEILGEQEQLVLSADFHDDEDEEDTQNNIDASDSNEQYAEIEGRILNKEIQALDHPKFFPEVSEHDQQQDSAQIVTDFNKAHSQRKLRFPSDTDTNDHKAEDYIRSGKDVQFRDDDEDHPEIHSTRINFIEDGNVKDTRRGKNIVFDESASDVLPQEAQVQSVSYAENYDPSNLGTRVIFPDHYEQHIRKGRILNRPSYADTYSDYVRSSDDSDRLVVSNAHRRPQYQDSSSAASNINYNSNNYNSAYYSQSSSLNQNNQVTSTHFYGNSGRPQPYSGVSSQSDRYQRPAANSFNDNGNTGNYNYPNKNYESNNRYSGSYIKSRTTRSPPQHEDDKNVYINNSNGVTEYYLTPDGRKIYL